MDHDKTLANMSPETRTNFADYWRGREKNRSVLLTFRVTPEERAAIRAAANWENKTVADFFRAAIAVRARDAFCKRDPWEQPQTQERGMMKAREVGS